MEGIIKSLVGDKRFGFIKVHDGTEYFFHQSDFNGFWNDLEEDFLKGVRHQIGSIKVTFEPDRTDKGLRARNVKREDWPN